MSGQRQPVRPVAGSRLPAAQPQGQDNTLTQEAARRVRKGNWKESSSKDEAEQECSTESKPRAQIPEGEGGGSGGESQRQNVLPSLQNPFPSTVSQARTAALRGVIILFLPFLSLPITGTFKSTQCKHNSIIEIPIYPSPHFNNYQPVPFSVFSLCFRPLNFYY